MTLLAKAFRDICLAITVVIPREEAKTVHFNSNPRITLSHYLTLITRGAMKLNMTIVCCILSATLLFASASAVSFPVMQCVNEAAKKGECGTEVKQALVTVDPWFKPYLDQKNRRHLLDCTRFCDPAIAYFTIHSPCNCNTRRVLSPEAETEQPAARNLKADVKSALEGPIQIFNQFTAAMPEGRCKTIFSDSQCIVTFVAHYEDPITAVNNTSHSGAGDADIVQQDTKNSQDFSNLTAVKVVIYDPATGKEQNIDPSTGLIIPDVVPTAAGNPAPAPTSADSNAQIFMIDIDTGLLTPFTPP